ncbi:MAG: aspartyl protease family protein, partial [Leptospiraceae bacterium]|nr:aspartyl protease family protein [Leptospiraceae bacterium]
EYEEIAAIPDVQTHWLFPISIKGKTYLFLFDTGADYTIYDAELAKNFLYLKEKTIQYMEFSGRLYESKVYFAPELCISVSSCTYNILGLSSSALSSFLKNSKYRIHGILGMNWIKNYKFALDYTKWKLYLIKR